MWIIPLLACTPPEPEAEPKACDDVAHTQVIIVTGVSFARRLDGISNGFNLDGHVSDASDSEGCDQADLVSPEGVPGIDNTFSALLPALEATEGAAIESLLQQTIDSGELLIALELEDVDDVETDDCVNVNVLQAKGSPRIGTDGVILSGQTFERDPTIEPSHLAGIPIVDGRLEARGFDLRIPVQIFDAAIDLTLEDAALSLTLAPDGTATGYIAGGVSVAYVSELVLNVNTNIEDLVISLLETYADLYPDPVTGVCPQFSAVLQVKATSGFLFD